jgi:recombination associated protein RdgC
LQSRHAAARDREGAFALAPISEFALAPISTLARAFQVVTAPPRGRILPAIPSLRVLRKNFMFRSVRFYSLTSPWPGSEQELSEQLARAAFKPCGPYVERSSGFEPPTGRRDGPLARRVAGADLLRLRSQVRVLPAAALAEALEIRLDEYRARMQEEPGRRTKRQLKEQTRDELLPKSLVRSERTTALYVHAERVLAVGSGSETRAERFVEHLRAAMPGLEIEALELDRPFGELLSRVFTGDAPREFIVAHECRLREIKDGGGTVRWQNVDLAHSTVQRCLKDGMEITHLAFEFGNALSGVLDGNGVLTKLELAGADEPPVDAPSASDPDAELASIDAEIALYGGTLRELLAGLRRALGGAAAAPGREPAAHQVIGTAAKPAALSVAPAAAGNGAAPAEQLGGA